MTSAPFRPPYPLNIASSVQDIEHRLQTFLTRDGPDGKRLSDVLSLFTGRFADTAIIGGMVRDFARVGAPGFHSDVDLVIDAPDADVQDFARKLGARTNAFGGNSVVLNGWEIDFWAMETTWAARTGVVVLARLEDLLRSTFFDHDAILYHLGRERIICGDDYIVRQRLNRLDINLEPNASVTGCVYRAARRIVGWELRAGPALARFIQRHLDGETYERMVAIEQRKKATPIIQSFGDVNTLRDALLQT